MATTSYTDIGAMQRIETGSPVAKTSYVDMGAVQRIEVEAGGSSIVPIVLYQYRQRGQ